MGAKPIQVAEAAARLGQTVLERIGRTPLLRLTRVHSDFPNAELYAKAEWQNPGGSVKDRPALYMIRDGERRGALRKGKIILDATSGNTGIAYAMLGAALGYAVKLCLPASASPERKRILLAYGAELVITPAEQGSDGAIRRVREIYAAEPEKYFYPDQYSNPANWRAHYETTAEEIWEQTEGRVTHFVAGLGTSGTFVGTARRLKELNPAVRCISLEPDSSFHGLEGWKHMASSIVPPIYDPAIADAALTIRTEDAYRMVKRLAREEALLVSVSAGAALEGCLRVAQALAADERAVIVTIFADSGEKYLSERFWEDNQELAGASVRISSELAEQIRLHGAAAYPDEACGALLGRDAPGRRELAAVLPLTNQQSLSPQNRFVITAEDVRRAESSAREQNLDLIGWYHSHPDHPARPSEFDREHAWPWYSYIILRVAERKPAEMTSWRLRDDRSGYEEEAIEVAAPGRP
jgi:cysteine synthase B